MAQSRMLSNPDSLLAAAQAVDLPLRPEHVAQLVPIVDATGQLLDALYQGELGEIAPANAFNAAWTA